MLRHLRADDPDTYKILLDKFKELDIITIDADKDEEIPPT